MVSEGRIPIVKTDVSALRSLWGEGRSVVALIELGLLEGLTRRMPSSLARRISASLEQSLFFDRADLGAAEIGPLLLETDAAERDWLIQFAQPLHAVSWIVPRGRILDIRDHMAAHLDASSEDGLRFLLRYYDPRVLEPYARFVDSLDWRHTLHFVASWHWVNPWGELCSLYVPESDQPLLRRNAAGQAYRLPLNAAQMCSLTRLCEPGALIDQLQSRVQSEFAAFARTSEHALASYLLRVAYSHGVNEFGRQVGYALDALGTHPLMHTHPVAQERLSAGVGLDSIIDTLTAKQRAQLVADLTRQHPPSLFEAPFGYADTDFSEATSEACAPA